MRQPFRDFRANRIPYLVYGISPALVKVAIGFWYRYLSRLDGRAEMVFMNWGYASLDPGVPTLALDAEDEVDRYCIQLYHHVANAVDLSRCDVLDLGCGRGGGSSYIARYLAPRSVIGVDLAAQAIDFCTRRYDVDHLSFRSGDAEALPFADGSFDAVVNIETSHYYATMAGFLREVNRVLRPAGYLLFADFRRTEHIPALRTHFADAGFQTVREERITANVLRALELDDERKMRLIRGRVPRVLQGIFREFAASVGTSSWRAFKDGSCEYVSLTLRKCPAPADGRTPAAMAAPTHRLLTGVIADQTAPDRRRGREQDAAAREGAGLA